MTYGQRISRTILLCEAGFYGEEEIFFKEAVSFLSWRGEISTPIRQSNSIEIYVFRIQDTKGSSSHNLPHFYIYTDLKQLLRLVTWGSW